MNRESKERTTWSRGSRWMTACVLFAFAQASTATHEVDHRYVIWGTAQDAGGAPIAAARIRITGLAGRPLAEGTTDADGNYRVLLHLHNDALGMKFWVTVGRSTRAGTVTFDPGDRLRAREHRVDLRAESG